MSWTDDRVALLKKLWGEGKTAAEIAQELGGVTRNAVIGKAHRLKLSNRVSPIQQNKKPAATKPPVEKKPKQKILAEDADRETVSLLELGARMCRWPIGDPREENFGFCGEHMISGLPYCAEHAKVAYQAATRNRILKEEQEAQVLKEALAKQAGAKKSAAK
ncbi:MAG: gcrA cell cycle regulator family protein [Alphaproteobacteria bacterium]|nr:gcrA cell cycle regulator family protein [Alphaproteobacteria bacterium]